MIKIYISIVAVFISSINGIAQQAVKIDKVSHAEPLYFDLVRDLGARKGEKEFNASMGFANIAHYNQYVFFMEYEFASINRLGFEVETDFSFFEGMCSHMETPNNELQYLKLSTQYSFFVSEKLKTTLAAGYTQVIELTNFKTYGKRI